MTEHLKNSGYVLDPHNHIWSRRGFSGILYNDGDAVEQNIANIIKQASDTTVFSTELQQHCTNWPSRYHLSGSRANILRPFSRLFTGDILEVGAGCGAITRYLGECGANVLSLEGTPRRAAITRSRTSDLENVTVLAEKFGSFQCDHKFDVITLIGVLEYANLFTTEENPALEMLVKACSLLKPEGRLIVAIENQLGLKYFAGAPEDHLGKPMYGIEGRYRLDQPQTFGRKTLSNLLKQAGFISSEFLAPFPDYKFPVSILTEKGINHPDFDASALAWQSVHSDAQLPRYCNFSLELAWPEIFKNEIVMDVTNSFLIISSPVKQSFFTSEVLAYHYSTERKLQYCKETRFEYVQNKIQVVYTRLGMESADDNNIVTFDCPSLDRYRNGKPMSWEFTQIVTRDGWSMEQVGEFLRHYISSLEFLFAQEGLVLSLTSLETRIPGKFLDCIPQNIIIMQDGTPVAIDQEWTYCKEIELGWLLFRGFTMMRYVTRFGKNSMGRLSHIRFLQLLLSTIGLTTLTKKKFYYYIELEAEIQKQITGRSVKRTLEKWWSMPLPTRSLVQTFGNNKRILSLSKIVSKFVRKIDLFFTWTKFF